jgi:hypothetical protein
MFFPSNLFTRFTRTPREGGRKDVPMPEAQATQNPPETATQTPRDDDAGNVSRQLATLTEAMRQLAESHKTLLEAVKAPQAAQQCAPAPAPSQSQSPAPPAPAPLAPDIGGDIPGGGQRPGAVVDYSRLSPVQQIAMGLKDAAAPRATVRAGAD